MAIFACALAQSLKEPSDYYDYYDDWLITFEFFEIYLIFDFKLQGHERGITNRTAYSAHLIMVQTCLWCAPAYSAHLLSVCTCLQ